MATRFAFVTLLTSDSYLPGALALAAAIKDVHLSPPTPPQIGFQTVCLVTPETVDVTTIKLLRRAFDIVVGVETIGQEDEKGLQLLGRPDLKAVLTKLHIFRLSQFSKIIFLDADVLPIQPLSHLFALTHEFSAVPDVGWPDIFNSGMMVLSPGEDKFSQINELLKSKGSWDGGDQGILNEWRGGDWNRLSFTYNTTPTAAYTYAPAYERYGSQISAIHFIGPNKPWNSISYRAPGTSSSQSTEGSSPERAYDYDSLVDRWYTIYDKHYRTHEVIPESDFEVRRYVSAWNEQSGAAAELASGQMDSGGAGGALGLDDLKRLAVEGISSAGFLPDDSSGEGIYTSMPLEGRMDLMPPRKDPEPAPPTTDPETVPLVKVEEVQTVELPSTPEGKRAPLPRNGTPPRMETLPTPGPNEIPPTPYLGGHSLPPTPSPVPPIRRHLQPPYTQPPESPQPQTQPAPKQRPPSPPMLAWNPAIEPPPTDVPDPSAFPTDTYFPNVWDQTHQEDNRYETSPNEPGSFFEVPPPSEIPEQLLRQGHYRNVTGEEAQGNTPSPDRSKVKSVFPWENRPRHLPGRIFPSTDSPPPGSIFIQSSPAPLSTPERKGIRASPMPSPLFGLPSNLIYANAWDTVPSIQKYASRLARPPQQPSPLQPAFEGGSRYRSWDERTEASSRDGDDEDEGDDEEGDVTQSGSDNGKNIVKQRSRSSSVSSSYTIKRGTREYRVRGVQTDAIQTRSLGVQVSEPLRSAPGLEGDAGIQHWMSTGGKRPSPPDSGADISPPAGLQDMLLEPVLPKEDHPFVSFPPIGDEDPSGMRSPREFSYSQDGSITQSPEQQAQLTTPPKLRPSAPTRKQTHDDDSPPSSTGPVSPPEEHIALPSTRKSGRVWDPARGVDLFKRGSEEVLARFLKMETWEDESSSAHM